MHRAAMYDERIDEYLNRFLPGRHPVVAQMEAYAKEHQFPIIGPHVGRLLTMFAQSIHAHTVFEMGSGFGYSAFWFALGMPEDGRLILTDGSEKNRELCYEFSRRLGIEDMLDYRVGDAVEILRGEEGPFDIIYNDIDKLGYPAAYRETHDRLRTGGLFITDNVLWHGAVADENPDENTRAIQEFNRLCFEDERFFSTILPVRDGLMVAMKREPGALTL
ncbi:O-methyltransferase [bacterium]|nr:O-methyltransferase [bacterium]